MKPQLRDFTVKYLNRTASERELDELSSWIKNPVNAKEFKSLVQMDYAIDHIMEDFNTEQEKKDFLSKIRKMQKQKKVRKLWTRISGVAASILIIISLSVLLDKDLAEDTVPLVVNNKIEPLKNHAVLLLETGEEIALEEGNASRIQNAVSSPEGLDYSEGDVTDTKIAYNYLTVPRGGQFFVKLADGTKVWLNSESKLKYPVHFIRAQSRVVELLYGEAFFEVSSSLKHQGADFKVIHKEQEIQVLGTEFNIKAYAGETKVFTTLVEGKVQINTPREQQILLPEQQAILDDDTYTLSIHKVNLREETGWVNGEFIVRRKNLKQIMEVLSRWYDMDVIFERSELEEVKFIGRIQKDQEITKILNRIKSFGIIKNYEINEKQLRLR
ncbi:MULTISPECIES: FecR family protein [Zunongwangia]|jgi:ferric-dicitrate binding protein FerR (iron transport regulator)|uniref:FecR family protein n=1 Tax=Zunongwangia TaxID=417127 RepID=UPI001D1905DC|nr:FecR family protein [Zunongwangia profunda]MCC4226823.1 FecR domain-containing protein [Zunongwangia profunda]|tara:strand:- start:17610 stop:18764 length:1155 start_codon:yes stop_codon:yes gene_type:complete